jgi:hypothetical protein
MACEFLSLRGRTQRAVVKLCVYLTPLFVVVAAWPAAASDFDTLKCSVNQDRVWVYNSLASFDVEAKVPCGEKVEIVSRVKGYVRIQTASGTEGYVPDSVFPDLPPLDDDKDKLGEHNATSLAAVAAKVRPSAAAPVSPTASESVSLPVMVEHPAEIAQIPVDKRQVAAGHAARPAKTAEIGAAPLKSDKPLSANTATAAKQTAPLPITSSDVAPIARTDSISVLPVSGPPFQPATIAASVSAASPSRPAEIVAVKSVVATPESDEYPDAQPENESADPACRVFFSAYGLGATQFKWFAENRRKQFANICPAPNLASVDFVILFTHDSDSYNSAMPTPVHMDRSGFSDFNPLTPVDPALMSLQDADKAHYTLAWVFRLKRGTFDPEKFSPRRRPQFSTASKGSRASVRAAEDALNFIEQQPANR